MSELNEQQRIIVESAEPRIVVSAAAGTGKTRVLTERIQNLIEIRRFSSYNILALTFTRFAATEMKERLGRSLVTGHLPEIMTFHAWALKYLRKFSREIGLRKDLDIITEVERNEILKGIAGDMNIKLVKFNYRDVIYDIDSAEPDIKIVVQKYLQIMKYYGLLDYDLLIVLFRKLIEDNEDVRNFLHNRYKHVLIDEFQDTNEYIWGIVQRLDPENVFLVGDVDQCLYGFNGARPDIMTAIAD